MEKYELKSYKNLMKHPVPIMHHENKQANITASICIVRNA